MADAPATTPTCERCATTDAADAARRHHNRGTAFGLAAIALIAATVIAGLLIYVRYRHGPHSGTQVKVDIGNWYNRAKGRWT